MPAPRAGLGAPPALYWELIPVDEHGDIVGVICPDCLTLREQRAIQADKARVREQRAIQAEKARVLRR